MAAAARVREWTRRNTAMAVTFVEAFELLRPSPNPLCYGLSDVETTFGERFTPEQVEALENVPFSPKVLRECAGTHMLFPTFGMSLLDIFVKGPHPLFGMSTGWYTSEPFAKKLLPVRWCLLRTTPHPESLNKAWAAQCSLLGTNETLVSAAVVAFATALHFRWFGQRLFEGNYVRTSDAFSDCFCASAGVYDTRMFYVYQCRDSTCDAKLGLASERLNF
jgi:hypothetical protein